MDVKNLYKVYNESNIDKRVVAVNDISFVGHTGEILGILGPNGSGKTTTVKSISSIIEFEKGIISVFGYDLKNHRKKILEQTGAVLEGIRNIYWNLTPTENMIYFASLKGLSKNNVKSNIDRYLTLLKLENVYKKKVKYFSNGMKQKVAIACAMISDPKLILLDEPTLGLDVETVKTMQDFLKEMVKEGKLFVITSHDMKFIEKVCSRIIIMKSGRIIKQDSVEKLNSIFKNTIFKITIKKISYLKVVNELSLISSHRIEDNVNIVDLFLPINDIKLFHLILSFFIRNEIDIIEYCVIKDDFDDIFMNILHNHEQF